MARGSKESYSAKQRRMAEHIEDSYKGRGSSSKRAERIAWATVNQETGGAKGKKSKGKKSSVKKAKGNKSSSTKKRRKS